MTQPNLPQSPPPGKEKKLLDQSEAINLKHYAPRTGDTYIHWAKVYILFHNKRHPKEKGAPEINQFLTHLASVQKVAASTQNQALSAILFLYRHILHIELDEVSLAEFRPQRAKTIPTCMNPRCKKPSKKPPALQKWTNMSPLTPSVIPSPPTSSKTGTTSDVLYPPAPSRNSSVTKM
jgi:hypothetical protein